MAYGSGAFCANELIRLIDYLKLLTLTLRDTLYCLDEGGLRDGDESQGSGRIGRH
jgi:hypothetical protein